MKHTSLFPPRSHALAIIPALTLLSMAFSACGRKAAPEDWNVILRPIQEKYAPDTRLAVFDVTLRSEPDRIEADGVVGSSEAKSEILRRAAEVSGKPVTDGIRVLPDPSLAPNDRGIVVVSVGNVRREPEHPAELVTQVLLGEVLRLLEKKSGWFHVQCSDRYLGWIDEDAVVTADTRKTGEWESSARLIVTRQCGLLRAQPGAAAAPLCDLAVGDLLRLVAERGSWYEAALADGRSGFVERPAAAPYNAWRASRALTPENIEATARSFMGVPYLWGGTSSKGFDCSGFVKTVFALNGTQLERDAGQQARMGKEIDPGTNFENLRRGDLLFFGRKAPPERIVHVAIYLADRKFIQCSGRVRISSLDPASPDYDEWHARRFVRARRFVNP